MKITIILTQKTILRSAKNENWIKFSISISRESMLENNMEEVFESNLSLFFEMAFNEKVCESFNFLSKTTYQYLLIEYLFHYIKTKM